MSSSVLGIISNEFLLFQWKKGFSMHFSGNGETRQRWNAMLWRSLIVHSFNVWLVQLEIYTKQSKVFITSQSQSASRGKWIAKIALVGSVGTQKVEKCLRCCMCVCVNEWLQWIKRNVWLVEFIPIWCCDGLRSATYFLFIQCIRTLYCVLHVQCTVEIHKMRLVFCLFDTLAVSLAIMEEFQSHIFIIPQFFVLYSVHFVIIIFRQGMNGF